MLKRILRIAFLTSVVGILATVALVLFLTQDLPPLHALKNYRPPIVTEVFDTNEVKIGEFYSQKRYVIPFEKIPKIVVQAFIAAEDDRFFQHQGLDFQGMFRAFLVNLKAGELKQGGSTITQQVARSLFLSRRKTIIRKIKEIILASTMEQHLSKNEILHLYLNQVFLGHGAYGIESAAHIYFGKSIKDLTLAEVAILAGLPQAPSHYTPYLYPNLAKQRQIYTLKRMKEVGFITEQQMQKALAEEVEIKGDLNFEEAPYFVEHVRKYLVEKYGNDNVLNQGLKVYTTLNFEFQKQAQNALKWGLKEVDKRRGYQGVLKHLSAQNIPQYLLQQHRALIEEKYLKRKLVKLGDGDYGFFIDPKRYEESTPFEKDKLYDGIVSSVGETTVEVKVGNQTGTIPFQDMRWARPIDTEVYWQERLIDKPSSVLKEGDVVSLKIIKLPGDNNGRTIFSLEQGPQLQGAVLSFEVGTGNILSMVGGYDFSKSEFNRAIQAYRQVGSTFKPVVYAAALDKGFTPASIVTDAPIVYKDEDTNVLWKPDNYGEQFYGDTLFRTALIKSRNIATIKIVQDISLEYILAYARKLGIESPLNEDLSSALGSSSTSLWEMSRAYSIFPNHGKLIEPVFIKKVVDRDGKVLEENKGPQTKKPEVKIDFYLKRTYSSVSDQNKDKEKAQALEDFFKAYDQNLQKDETISPQTAFIMTHLLQGVVQEGTGWKLKELNRPVAGKTGTTDNYEDAWFVGFTPDIVTGVWVGMDDKKEAIGKLETGSSAAAPIWVSYMKEVLRSYPKKEFETPPAVTFVKINSETGQLADPLDPKGVYEVFKEGTEPTETQEEPPENSKTIDTNQKKELEDESSRGF